MCEKFGNDSYRGSLDRERKQTASGAGGGVWSETIVSHETEFWGDTISSLNAHDIFAFSGAPFELKSTDRIMKQPVPQSY